MKDEWKMKGVHADRMGIGLFCSWRHCPWQSEGGYDPKENNCHLSFGPHVFLLKTEYSKPQRIWPTANTSLSRSVPLFSFINQELTLEYRARKANAKTIVHLKEEERRVLYLVTARLLPTLVMVHLKRCEVRKRGSLVTVWNVWFMQQTESLGRKKWGFTFSGHCKCSCASCISSTISGLARVLPSMFWESIYYYQYGRAGRLIKMENYIFGWQH